jgi:hypothetical protein
MAKSHYLEKDRLTNVIAGLTQGAPDVRLFD